MRPIKISQTMGRSRRDVHARFAINSASELRIAVTNSKAQRNICINAAHESIFLEAVELAHLLYEGVR
jgi:hypothetical protein